MIDKEIKDELASKVDSNRFNEHLLLQMNINNAIYGALLRASIDYQADGGSYYLYDHHHPSGSCYNRRLD